MQRKTRDYEFPADSLYVCLNLINVRGALNDEQRKAWQEAHAELEKLRREAARLQQMVDDLQSRVVTP